MVLRSFGLGQIMIHETTRNNTNKKFVLVHLVRMRALTPLDHRTEERPGRFRQIQPET